jgi:signal transduction histidine kinase
MVVPRYRSYVLFGIVFLIGLLLLANIYWIYRNNGVIEFNKKRQAEAERIKVNTVDVIRSLHLLDLSVRSYVFVRGDHFLAAIDTALTNNIEAFNQLEGPLTTQGFPMDEFYRLKDSVAAYVEVTHRMMEYIRAGDESQFVDLLEADPGYYIWLQHRTFTQHVNTFEDEIVATAQLNYEEALQNTYILQILLFLIAIPTLSYTAYYTNRTLVIADKLRDSERRRSALLLDQNKILEKTVYERTREILAQNEEISAQNEHIVLHNEQLQQKQREIESQRSSLTIQNEKLREANQIIEDQSLLIQQRNKDLGKEVERQTNDLRATNLELMEKNSRLEQFTFIISHNLRAPMARIAGLSTILEFTRNPQEIADIVKYMVKSMHDLDQVVKDLTLILDLQRSDTQSMTEARMDVILDKVTNTLEEEISAANATVKIDLGGGKSVVALYPYLESIFYNLVSNAIKYRHPERDPLVSIRSKSTDEYLQIDVQDNGLGIDIDKHSESLFSLYKRFHFHVDGKGLGLYLVKTQVAALGGRIEVNSVLNEGTTFSVFFRNA